MKKRKKTSRVKNKQNGILVLPCIIAGILLLQIIFNFIVSIISTLNGQKPTNDAGLGLLLSIIGIAVTVWVGLNLYNIYSKQDLQKLLEQAERASSIVSKMYTETLISKFRLSSKDGTARFYASELSGLDPLPEKILEQLLDIEDIYLLAYEHYREATRSTFYEEGILRINGLCNNIQINLKNSELTKAQIQFLQGYSSLRRADFTHFLIQYPPTQELATDINLYEKCIKNYRDGIYILFGIRDVPTVKKIDRYSTADQTCISFVYNSIGAIQLHYRIITGEKTTTIGELNPIEAVTIALAFGNPLPPMQLAIFERNLGAAYEHNGQMEDAFFHYAKSYELDKRNWKTAHCIGSWYYKQAKIKHPEIVNAQKTSCFPRIENEKREEVYNDLKKACHWFEVEKATNCGIQDREVPYILSLLAFLDNSSENIAAAEQAVFEQKMHTDLGAAAQKKTEGVNSQRSEKKKRSKRLVNALLHRKGNTQPQ